MKKTFTILIGIIALFAICGCQHLSEMSYAQAEKNLEEKTIESITDTGEDTLRTERVISVDGITGTSPISPNFVILPPEGKSQDLLFEKVSETLSKALATQGYTKVSPEKADTILVLTYSSSSREGQIAIVAYDAKTARKNKDDPQKAYKVLGKTLIYYVSSASEDFSTVYPGVISEVAPYILKDVVPTKYFGKKQKTGTSAK